MYCDIMPGMIWPLRSISGVDVSALKLTSINRKVRFSPFLPGRHLVDAGMVYHLLRQ